MIVESNDNPVRGLLKSARDKARTWKDGIAWKLRKRGVQSAMQVVPPLPAKEHFAGATVFFVPYAGVTPMFSQTCVVARTLAERGHRVFVARCFQLFDRCPVMDMHRLPYTASADQKRESCVACADNSLSMLTEYRLDPLDLRPLATSDMLSTIDRALEGAPRNLLRFEFEGLPFGKLSVMDVILARKISDVGSIDGENRSAWLQYLRSSLLSHLLVDRLCREFAIGRIVHVNDYSLLLGARTAAQKHGVPAYSMAFPGHRNVDLRRYLILPNVWKPSSFELLAGWTGCRDLPLDADRVAEVAEDLLVRLGGVGSHQYSPAKTTQTADIRERLGLSKSRRLLVAYTSSLDEIIASRMGVEALKIPIPDRPQPFDSQIEWLTALAERVEHTDDMQLVVRVHPREGVNPRESVASQHLHLLRAAFDRPLRHCCFVWPEDKISSYDLGEAADLVLTSWSTIGLEMARLGVPVLVAFNGAMAAIAEDDFLEWARTPDLYFMKLRELLERPVSLPQVARAFRWYSLHTLGTTVDLSDVVPRSDFSALPEFRMPREAALIEDIILRGANICQINMERLRSSQSPQSAEREQTELKRQLRRIVHVLMTGTDDPRDAPLTLIEGGDESDFEASRQFPGDSRLLVARGFTAEYHDAGSARLRYSPMAVRLARLCANGSRIRGRSVEALMIRFLIVNTDYPEFLKTLYASHPGLAEEPYARQLAVRHESLFGVSDFYPRNLNDLGHFAVEVHVNNEPLQRAWAREHGVQLSHGGRTHVEWRKGFIPWPARDERRWMTEILRAQVEDAHPDVILTHSLSDFTPGVWKGFRRLGRVFIGQIASPLAPDVDLSPFDLMLTSLPNFVERFRRQGLRSELFRLAFDPSVLESLQRPAPTQPADAPIDVSFVGSLSPHHKGRTAWLEYVCRDVSIQVWGQGVDELPTSSAIRRAFRGPAFGIDMFRILQRSRISLNHHIELAEQYANNMRLYETTGVGTLLLTDWKENLAEMFEPEREAATYRSAAECVERIRFYLAHEPERSRIAAAGQERTLREHTYRDRMQQLVHMVGGLL